MFNVIHTMFREDAIFVYLGGDARNVTFIVRGDNLTVVLAELSQHRSEGLGYRSLSEFEAAMVRLNATVNRLRDAIVSHAVLLAR